MRVITTLLAGAACALLLAVSLPAAGTPAATHNQKAPTAERTEWPAETLSGTIMMVNPIDHLVVVKTAGGVPFDMVVTPHTKIESGAQSVTLQDLSSDINKSVSVRFRPEGRGDVARTIQING